MIEKQEVIKIAKLSRLAIEEEKIDKFQKDFSGILDYISELKKLNTEGAKEMSHSIEIESALREDASLKFKGDYLINRQKKDDYLIVKRILP